MEWTMRECGFDERVISSNNYGTCDNDTLSWEFRLMDDDDNVMFEGICQNPNNYGQDEAFDPLDWGMADSGCTQMEIRNREDQGLWDQM